MTTASWPSSLPPPLRDPYAAERQDVRRRRASEGPPSFSKRFSSRAKFVSLTIEVSRSGKATFDDFYDIATADGTLPFWMPDPTTDGFAMLRTDGMPVLDGDGSPLLLSAQWLCIFNEPVPVERVVGGRFEIAFNVAVMP